MDTGLAADLNVYSKTKNLYAQALGWYCASDSALSVLNIKLENFYGPDEPGDRFIPSTIAKLLKDQDIPLTEGRQVRDFIHIDELAKQIAICSLQDKVLGIINCCSGKPVSLAEQIEWYIAHNKLAITLEYGKYPDRPYDSPCVYGDNKKILEILRSQIKE